MAEIQKPLSDNDHTLIPEFIARQLEIPDDIIESYTIMVVLVDGTITLIRQERGDSNAIQAPTFPSF